MEKATLAIIFGHKKIKNNLWQLIPKEPVIGQIFYNEENNNDVPYLFTDDTYYEFVNQKNLFEDSVAYPINLGEDEVKNIAHFYFKDIAKNKYFELIGKDGQKFFYQVTENDYLLTTNILSFYGDEKAEYIGNVIYNKKNELDIKYLLSILKSGTSRKNNQISNNDDKGFDTVKFEASGGYDTSSAKKFINNTKSGINPDKIGTTPTLNRKEKYNSILNVVEAYNKLSQVIISQDQALKAVLLTIRNNIEKADENWKINNILLIGPTGVGKTLMVHEIAKILNVPFVSIDSSNYTPTGYVGSCFVECLESLYLKAKGDLKLAQKGIVFIDEFDKIAIGNSQDYVRTVGVQDALLTMVEGHEYNLTIGKDKNIVPFNTSKVTFIASGAFEKITTPKLQNMIGFNSSDAKPYNYKNDIDGKLINYGMKGELVGRFVKVLLNSLTVEDIVKIILSKGCIFNYYLKFFSDYNIQFEYTNDFIFALAKYSMTKNGGARGIDQVIEEVFQECLFKIFDPENNFSKLIVDEQIVEDPKKYILR